VGSISWDEALDAIAERILRYKEEFGASRCLRLRTGGERSGDLPDANCLGSPNVLTRVTSATVPA